MVTSRREVVGERSEEEIRKSSQPLGAVSDKGYSGYAEGTDRGSQMGVEGVGGGVDVQLHFNLVRPQS